MVFHRCPKCSTPYTDTEIEQGVTCCDLPLGPARVPLPEAMPPAQSAAPVPRRAAPFLLGLFIGCLIGPAAMWMALRLGAPPSGEWIEQTAAFQAVLGQKTEAENSARESEAGRRAAESARAEAVQAMDAARQQATNLQKQKGDAERRLQDALARLAQEKGPRAALEKVLPRATNPKLLPTRSFVRDWQLLGPFAVTGGQPHDTVYLPEREAVQLRKAYNGFGGPVKWQPYESAEDKIDLADFFDYRQAGIAYAVSWAYSEVDRAVTLGVGSDDGIRLWVNGEKVHDVKGGRQARPGQDLVKARLKQGWNEIRAKVDNILGTWELYLEFRTEDGARPLPVFSTCSPPPAAAR